MNLHNTSSNKSSNLGWRFFLKLIFAGLFGYLIGLVFSCALAKGSEYLFEKSDVYEWGLIFWGDHWLLRTSVSIFSTFIGGFIAGIVIIDDKKHIAGIISALPSVLPMIGLLVASPFVNIEFSEFLPHGKWFVLTSIILLSIPIAVLAEHLGQDWRASHPDWYGLPRRPLGIHWTTYLWLPVPLYFAIIDTWYTCLYALRLFSNFNFHFLFSIGVTLWWFALILQFNALKSSLIELSSSSASSKPPLKVAKTVTFNMIVIPIIAMSLRALSFVLFGIKENLPKWVYWLFQP